MCIVYQFTNIISGCKELNVDKVGTVSIYYCVDEIQIFFVGQRHFTALCLGAEGDQQKLVF